MKYLKVIILLIISLIINVGFCSVQFHGMIPGQNGTKNISIELYSSETSEEILWSETHYDVLFSRGEYALDLGSINPLIEIDESATYYIETYIDDELYGSRIALDITESVATISDGDVLTSGGGILEEMTPSLEIGNGTDDVIIVEGSDLGIGLASGADATGALEVRGDEVRIWDGTGTVDYASGEGDIFIEDDLEVDGAVYASAYRDKNGGDLFNVATGSSLTASEDSDGSWTLGLSGGGAGETYTFTNCAQTGRTGPSQTQANTAYSSTTLDGDVTVTNGIQYWDVPATGTYTIDVYGAQGISAQAGRVGGNGAYMSGEFNLTAGTTLKILVGQQGTSDGGCGGGGGGSFVTYTDNTPLIIAGGGAGTRSVVSQDGCDGVVSQYAIIGSGSSETSTCAVKTTGLAGGGIVSSGSWGSAGGGLNSNGANDGSYGYGGSSYVSGGYGGNFGSGGTSVGGFGCGGSGCGSDGGGGGGGYSGGDGGRVAGGGGSYCSASGTLVASASGDRAGHGLVVITAPTSSTLDDNDWTESAGTLTPNNSSDNIGLGTTTATGKLDVRDDEVRVWDGTATVDYADGVGDLYVEDALEVDGTIYSSAYKSNSGGDLFNIETGTPLEITEEADGSYTIGEGTGTGTGLTYTFTNCGQTGRTGPTQTQANTTYSSTTLDGAVTVTGGIQAWTVPATGVYTIEASGAAGGRQTYSSGYNGGRGAIISGEFNLTAGETIYIICGQKGEDTRSSQDNAAPGGGGGTFVYTSATATTPLIAAGGGGSGARCVSVSGIQDASYTTTAFRSGSIDNGGSAGNGGRSNSAASSSYWAGGGCGWLTDGTGGNVTTNYSYNGSYGDGGRSPRYGALGGVRYNDGTDEGGDGGFGGGGGGGSDNMGGGGGGGYSGGGGASSTGCGNEPGGGGASYNSGASATNVGYNTGHGQVVITSTATSGLNDNDWANDDAGTMTAYNVSDNIGMGTSTVTGKLDVRGDEVRVWDGSASVGYATGAGDVFVEDALEVDGTIYSSAYKDNTGGDLINAASGSPITVTEDADGSWTLDVSGGGTSDEVWTFDSNLDGWSVSNPCSYGATWTWTSESGRGTVKANYNYANTSSMLLSPVVTLGGVTTVNLEYIHRWSTESCCDEAFVQYRLDGGSWQHFTPTTGAYTGSHNCDYDPTNSCSSRTLTSYYSSGGYATHSGDITVGTASTIQIAMVITADGSVTSSGWWIDEVTLSGIGGGVDDGDWTGASTGTMSLSTTTDNVGLGTTTATGKLDIRNDEMRVWDGSASVGYANGVGDVFVEDALEADGTIYSSAYKSNTGANLINAGTGIAVTEETDGSYTIELSSTGTGETYTFTNCGQTGRTGPTQTQANTEYSGTSLAGAVTVTTGIQAWTVPATGTYTIEAYGAAGGRQTYSSGYNGGRGAIISGEFNLTGGETIYIICGQKGEDTRRSVDNAAPGGGGGSFVYRSATATTPLIAAGGGGSGARCSSVSGIQDASYTTTANRSGSLANGGSAGNGGRSNAGGSSYWAGGGCGWLTDGTGGNVSTNYSYNGSYGDGGRAPRYGALGGVRYNDGTDEGGDGGFGGGGGGGSDNMGGGGGGGYSGGGGARYEPCGNEPGGGGASYNSGASATNVGYNTGHGMVIITSDSGGVATGDNDWTGAGTGTMTATNTTDNVGIGTSSVTGKLDIRGDEVRVWDGAASVGYATGAGDVFVEDALEVDGSIYGAGYRDNTGGDLINAGTGMSVTEEADGSWTVGVGSGGGSDFYVTSMLSTSSGVVDHSSYSGDDRGGIAITQNYYYYTGDSYTVRYTMPNLTSPVSYTRNDGLFSDLSGTGTLYTLWNGSSIPSGGSPYTVTSIRTLNADLSLGTTTISLSSSISMSSLAGIYSGYGCVILQSGNTFYHVAIPSGTVTNLGTYTNSRYSTENWSMWGIAECNSGVYSVLYRTNSTQTISRLNLSTGAITTLASFSSLSDMACITYSPWHNRWYFHHEGSSQFGGSSETAGYAAGTHYIGGGSGGLSIEDLTDVNLTSVAEGDLLYYDGTEWINLGLGTSGQVVTSDGSIPGWSDYTGGSSGGSIYDEDRTFYTTHGPVGGKENNNYTYYYRVYYGNAGDGPPYVYSYSSESDDYVMNIPTPEVPEGHSITLDEVEFKFYNAGSAYSYYGLYIDDINWESSSSAPSRYQAVNTNWYGSGYMTRTHAIGYDMDADKVIRVTWDSNASGTSYRFYGVRCLWTIDAIGGGTSPTGTQTFSYTGSSQTWTVPTGVTSVDIQCWGAEGGGRRISGNSSSGLGGLGGYSSGTLAVTPGSTLYIYIGGQGSSSTSGAAAGGYNGGGSGYASGSSEPGNGGGGGTDVRYGGTAFSNRRIVAGGGGGGGEDSGDQYGHGGGNTGVGYSTTYDGSQTSAGTGGGLGYGGTTNLGDGGGGGGGYYGGGTYYGTSVGRDTQGGGGGSGYIGGVTSGVTTAGNESQPSPSGGTQTGNQNHGTVILTW